MLKRLHDWPARLAAAIDSARGLAFGYGPGQSHCCLFSSDVVRAITGTDVYAWFRGRYKCERGAYLALRRFAGGGVAETVSRIADQCGAPEIPVSLAGRGDVVLFNTPDGPAMGICVGAELISVTRPHGLATLPMTSATRVWRV